MNQFHDAECMDKFLNTVIPNGLQDPGLVPTDQFLPAGSSVLDFLAVSRERQGTWSILPREEISAYQQNRGLSYKMLDEIQVKEINVGVSTDEEIQDAVDWFWENYKMDQDLYPSTVISMDCEELKMEFSPGMKISPRKLSLIHI